MCDGDQDLIWNDRARVISWLSKLITCEIKWNLSNNCSIILRFLKCFVDLSFQVFIFLLEIMFYIAATVVVFLVCHMWEKISSYVEKIYIFILSAFPHLVMYFIRLTLTITFEGKLSFWNLKFFFGLPFKKKYNNHYCYLIFIQGFIITSGSNS